jgi:hypothetical protein
MFAVMANANGLGEYVTPDVLEDMVWNLQTWPLDLVDWPTHNSHRLVRALCACVLCVAECKWECGCRWGVGEGGRGRCVWLVRSEGCVPVLVWVRVCVCVPLCRGRTAVFRQDVIFDPYPNRDYTGNVEGMRVLPANERVQGRWNGDPYVACWSCTLPSSPPLPSAPLCAHAQLLVAGRCRG